MKNFNEVRDKHFEKLELYVPVVARVHGKEHPEFLDVHEEYKKLVKKMENMESEDLNEEFEKLRKITDNYKVPSDTCESYEAVYEMLSDLDEAYNE